VEELFFCFINTLVVKKKQSYFEKYDGLIMFLVPINMSTFHFNLFKKFPSSLLVPPLK